MAEPNLMIIGAAKAGTSALHSYLKQHPDIFMTQQKELRYFMFGGKPNFRGPGDENLNELTPATYDEYCQHFDAANGQAYRGESSPFYLCAEQSPALIRDRLPDCKLIIILREPVSRAWSSFTYLHTLKKETETDFSDALEKEPERIANNYEFMWHYRKLGLYSEQLERYFDYFPREQVFVGLYDDLNDDPDQFVRAVFDFLGVDTSFNANTMGRANASGKPRSKLLHKVLSSRNPVRVAAGKMFPSSMREQMLHYVHNANLKKDSMPEESRKELQDYYRADIDKLEKLIARDLTAWKC